MNPLYLQFSQKADAAVTDVTTRAKIVAAAIAQAIAHAAALPSSEVESAPNHFNMQVLMSVRNTVSQFNENMVFDAKSVIDQVRSLWMVRYFAAHPVQQPIYGNGFDYFETIFGVHTYVAPETIEFLNKNKTEILYLASEAACILATQGNQNG